jgi:hypothetical protein
MASSEVDNMAQHRDGLEEGIAGEGPRARYICP